MDHPDNPCAAAEKVSQPFGSFRARVAGRKDLHCQIGRTREKSLGVRLEPEPQQPFFRDKGDIRRAAVPVFHPESHVGTEHGAESVEAIESFQGEVEALADLFVLEVVFGACDQFAIDELMEVGLFGQGLKFGFGPGFTLILSHRTLEASLFGRRPIVNAWVGASI